MIELRHLKYFLALAEEMNFTRAAQRLHVAQPPLSVQIKDLEEMVAVPLLDRSSRPFRLTQAGLYFKEECRRLLADVANTLDQTKRVGKGRQGWLGIGFIPSTLHGFLPGVLAEFRAKNPEIEVVLNTMNRGEQIEALKSRRIHIGITRPKLDTDAFEQTLVHRDALGFACPKNHAFANRESISLKELKDENFIAYDGGVRPGFFNEIVLRACIDAGFEPNVAMEVDQPITALSAVAAGFGISLVANSLTDALSNGCCIIPIEEPAPQNPIYIAYRHDERAESCLKFIIAIKSYETGLKDSR